MADGDITTMKELGRISIPGGGINVAGADKNNKVMVWGRLVATYDTLGLDLLARGGLRAFGVETADFWSFDVQQGGATATAVPTTKAGFLADLELITTPNRLFIADQVGADSIAEPSDAETFTINWLVIGDDARAPVLT